MKSIKNSEFSVVSVDEKTVLLTLTASMMGRNSAVMGAGEDHHQLQGSGVVDPALSLLGCRTLISIKGMQCDVTP